MAKLSPTRSNPKDEENLTFDATLPSSSHEFRQKSISYSFNERHPHPGNVTDRFRAWLIWR